MALVIHPGNIPHNHPMPPMSKASIETKAAYRKCVKAAQVTGATVQKVDLGMLTYQSIRTTADTAL